MTLRTRFSLTIAGISLLLVLPAAYAVSQLRSMQVLAEGQRRQHGAAYIALGDLQSSLAELEGAVTEFAIMAMSADPDTANVAAGKHAEMMNALADANVSIRELHDANYAQAAARTGWTVAGIGVGAHRVSSLIADGRFDEAEAVLDNVKARIASAGPGLGLVADEIDRQSLGDIDEAAEIGTRAATTSLAALGLCLLLAIGLGAWTTRALTLPIVRLRNAMSIVADGDFDVPTDLAFHRDDEIGSASRSFRAMTLQLAELDRLKAEFLSFATHELRTPLNVVSGYAELLRDGVYGDMSASQQEALEAIRDQTAVISQLSSQLLDIGRLEAGGLRLEIRDTPPASLIQRVERAFDPLARQKNIELHCAIDPATPDSVPVDPNRICDQVLGNLLSNALKFTPEGGRVTVRAHVEDGKLAIDVSDTGPGIPADKLPQVFERYYQVGDEARRHGAGLGLSIALAIARAHGGDIDATSETDRGATFRVRLPLDSGTTSGTILDRGSTEAATDAV